MLMINLNLLKQVLSFISSKLRRSPSKKSSIWATLGTNKYSIIPK